VVKPAIAGDPQRLRQVWGTGGTPLVFSSVFETGVGRRVGLALAHQYQQQTGQSLALGFDTLNRFEDDWDQLSPYQLWQRL
jgi:O-succinylbenzoate synthase